VRIHGSPLEQIEKTFFSSIVSSVTLWCGTQMSPQIDGELHRLHRTHIAPHFLPFILQKHERIKNTAISHFTGKTGYSRITKISSSMFNTLCIAIFNSGPGQTESQVEASWKLGSTWKSVRPGLACTCVDLLWFALTLVEIKFACKAKQFFCRLATQLKSTEVEWRPFVAIATH